MEKSVLQIFLKDSFAGSAASDARTERPMTFIPHSARAVAMFEDMTEVNSHLNNDGPMLPVAIPLRIPCTLDNGSSVDEASEIAPATTLVACVFLQLIGLGAIEVAKLMARLPDGPLEHGNWRGGGRA
jgi:hypothetical protein